MEPSGTFLNIQVLNNLQKIWNILGYSRIIPDNFKSFFLIAFILKYSGTFLQILFFLYISNPSWLLSETSILEKESDLIFRK